MTELDIGVRLKEYRRKSGKKMPEIAAATDISKETLYKWEKGTKPSDLQAYMRLHEYLLKGEEALQKETSIFEGAKIVHDLSKPMILKDRRLTIENIDAVVIFTDHSMANEYKPGCKLCLSNLINIQKLVWGEVYYFVDLNEKGILRRVYQTDDESQIRLVSNDAVKYPDILRYYGELKAVFEIVEILSK